MARASLTKRARTRARGLAAAPRNGRARMARGAAPRVTVTHMSGPAPTRRQALTAENLADLGEQLLRQLCQMLIVERGVQVVRAQPRDHQDDFHVRSQLYWRDRPGLVRLMHRALEPADV